MKKILKHLNQRIYFYIAGLLTALILGSLFSELFKSNATAIDRNSFLLIDAKNSPSVDWLDDEYTATAYVDMGGGAAGWCEIYISVVNIRDFDKIMHSPYTVANTTDCAADISLNWIDKNNLEITGLDKNDNDKLVNNDGKVKIIYK